MSEQASLETETTTATNPPWWWWLLAGLALVLLIWLVVLLSRSRPLKMWPDSAVSPDGTLNGQALLVDFDALNDNPSDYVNQRIRVSGNFLRLAQEECAQFNGPRIQWGLVADELQLNARGFEAIVLSIVPDNTQMTLEGIWRRYPGPVGCGKEPERGLWYLDVEQIVQPNPLVAGSATPVRVLSITPPPFPTVTPTGTTGAQPPAGGTPIPNVTIVSTVVVNTPTSTPTLDGTAVPGTPTATATSTTTATVTTTPGPGTPTAGPGTATATPTPTTTGTPGSGTAEPTPTSSSLVTATPGGYPGPTSSPPPTSYP